MPQRPKRQLKHPERKLRKVPKRIWTSIGKDPWVKDAKFYYDLDRNVFAVKLAKVYNQKIWNVSALRRTSGEKFKVFANTSFMILPYEKKKKEKLLITGLEKKDHLNDKGQLLFRAILNEAIEIAKKEKVNIEIWANNKKMADYYASFGFEITKRHVSFRGTLKLFEERETE